MPHSLDDVACACLALRSHHGCAFTDATQCLAQITCAAHKGHGEEVFVDMEVLIGGSQDFGLIDAVDANGLENFGFDKVPDAALRHNGNSDSLFNLDDEFGVAHASNATLRSNVGGHALQCHHC